MTGQEGNTSPLNAFLAALATLLMTAGGLILRKLNKTPRPKDLTGDDYARMRQELEEHFRRDLRPIREALDSLSRQLASDSSSTRGDIQEIRGELGQLSMRVSRQGGVLKGLEDRLNAN